MRDVFNVYEIELKAKGPIFIGSGKEIAKKEYAILDNEHKVAVFDQLKLIKILQTKGLVDEYQRFMLGTSRDDVGTWLKDRKISENEYSPLTKYQLDYGNAQIDTHSKLGIYETVRDPYGFPYIPGSSLKGLLRTVLLADDIVKNKSKYQYINCDNSKKANMLEEVFYRTLCREKDRKTDAVNDIMSGFILSDSEPLSNSDLVLCQRVEYHVDGREKKMNVLRECIKPGTVMHFSLTIDPKLCNFSKRDIESAIESFGEVYYRFFLSKYPKMPMPTSREVWLGGGVGFASKTEVYPLYEKNGVRETVKIFSERRVPINHKHSKDIGLDVSPHVCKVTYYQNERLQMGNGELLIHEKNQFSPDC